MSKYNLQIQLKTKKLELKSQVNEIRDLYNNGKKKNKKKVN